jgi:hypothetical protein
MTGKEMKIGKKVVSHDGDELVVLRNRMLGIESGRKSLSFSMPLGVETYAIGYNKPSSGPRD